MQILGLTLRRFVGATALFVFVISASPAAADGVVYTSWGKAIKGYDPVAYFTQSKPVEGDSDFTHKWMGATWRFASADNRD